MSNYHGTLVTELRSPEMPFAVQLLSDSRLLMVRVDGDGGQKDHSTAAHQRVIAND